VNLPRLLVLTDRSMTSDPLPDTIATAVQCGARAVVLREKDLPADARAGLAARLARILEPVGGVLITAGAPAPGDHESCVHLADRDEFPAVRPRLVGRSCHSADEVARATAQRCDYITVSPVFLTASKPGYGPALGIAGLEALAASGPPAYALGGVRPDAVPACLHAGARGIAVMGAVMHDPTVVSDYLSQLTEVQA
jgi:thiamine monophosphate synthase